jgi:hypothetical protein
MYNRQNKNYMRLILIALTVITSLQLASAQDKLSREDALKYAFLAAADLKQLQGTPIPTDVDLKQPVAVQDGEFGGMVLPEAKLTAESIAKAGEKIVPIGQVWLHKLTPMRDGEAVASDKLRLAKVTNEGTEVQVPQCTLGVRRTSAGALELVVLGKSTTPLVTVPLKAVDGKEQAGIDLTAERDSEAGHITLTIVGKYQAKIDVTQLEL